jgi:hypothetical protein
MSYLSLRFAKWLRHALYWIYFVYIIEGIYNFFFLIFSFWLMQTGGIKLVAKYSLIYISASTDVYQKTQLKRFTNCWNPIVSFISRNLHVRCRLLLCGANNINYAEKCLKGLEMNSPKNYDRSLTPSLRLSWKITKPIPIVGTVNWYASMSLA